MNTQKIVSNEVLETTVGFQGRMITGSKSGYRKALPENAAVFNANLVVPDGEGFNKIWHGDLDLTLDGEKILKLSKEIQLPIYVLREMDARFNTEEEPKVENAIAIYDCSKPEGQTVQLMSTEYYTLTENVIKLKKL